MRYLTLAQVKTHLGITGTGQDDFLKQEIKRAEDRLDSMMSVSRLDIHKVTDERHNASGTELYLKDYPVVGIGEILDDTTTYTQTDSYDIDNYVVYLQNYLVEGKRKAHVTYSAGYNASGIVKLTVSDYSLITATMTLDIALGGSGSNILTEGTDWTAGTDNNTTATSIASAVNTLSTAEDILTGVRAFALENVVYIIDETANRESTTITASSLAGLSLVSGGGTVGTTSALTFDGRNMPRVFEDVLMLMIGGAMTNRKSLGITSYSIGSKTVNYGSKTIDNDIKKMITPYKRAKISVI